MDDSVPGIPWICNPENYQAALVPLTATEAPVVFTFNLFTTWNHIFRAKIPPLTFIEKIEVAAFKPEDVEYVRISDGRTMVWEGTKAAVFNVTIPTNNAFLELEVKHHADFKVPPQFCWARVTMKQKGL